MKWNVGMKQNFGTMKAIFSYAFFYDVNNTDTMWSCFHGVVRFTFCTVVGIIGSCFFWLECFVNKWPCRENMAE